MLGDREQALDILKTVSLSPSAFNQRALPILLRSLDPNQATEWLRVIAQDSKRLRYLIMGMGIMGDPYHIPWVITQLNHPEVAMIHQQKLGRVGVFVAFYLVRRFSN